MTPTPEQLAAVLPRCSAGLDGGDWTDDDDRLAWARRVLRYVEAASHAERPTPASRESRTFDDVEGARRAFFDWSATQVPKPTRANPGKSWPPPHPPAEGITYYDAEEADT